MRFVVRTAPGVVELAWTWLPAFIAFDTHLKKRIEDELAPLLEGKELNEPLLDAAHERVVDIITKTHEALPGLRDYIDSIKYVDDTKRG